ALPIFRAADRAEQHGVGVAARGERLVGERRADFIDRRAAERQLDELDVDGQRLEHADGLPEHLGADPVAGQQREAAHRLTSRLTRSSTYVISSSTPSSESGPPFTRFR